MHIISQNPQNYYYSYHLKQKVLPITIYQLVRQKISQQMKSKDTKEKKCTSFDQFKDLQFGIRKMMLSDIGSEWNNGFYNCSNFFKEYICKHVIDMAIR